MGKVKSIRFNDKTDRMFSAIKKYYQNLRKNMSDSEIIILGIELQFDHISKELNAYFVDKMRNGISKKPQEITDIFETTLNMLEVLSVSEGTLLQDMFEAFFMIVLEGSEIYSNSDGLRNSINKPCLAVYNSLIKTFGESAVNDGLELCCDIFYKNFPSAFKLKK